MLGNSRAVLLLRITVAGLHPGRRPGAKDAITLDEFMNTTEIKQVKLSPDGSAAVMATASPDWQHSRFSTDLWIWKEKTGRNDPAYPIRARHLSAMVPGWEIHRVPLRCSFA